MPSTRLAISTSSMPSAGSGVISAVTEQQRQPRNIRQHRNRLGQEVEHRLDRVQRVLDVVNDRLEEVADEASELQRHVLELAAPTDRPLRLRGSPR